jgi:hypothetical protein
MSTFYYLTITGNSASVNGYIEVNNGTNAVINFYANDFSTSLLKPGGVAGIYTAFLGIQNTEIIDYAPYQAILTTTDSTGYRLNSNIILPNGTFTGLTNGTPNTVTFNFQETACFNEGTKILCLNNKEEEYVPIEQLRKGDVVKTYHYGYRKIDMIGKNYLMNQPTNNFRQTMYKMVKTPENGLIDDLIVTGGHSILVDSISESEQERFNDLGFPGFSTLKIEDKHLLLAAASSDFVKLTDVNKYTYYHFILENDGNDNMQFGVWANGVLTETIHKNSFMNQSFILL